MKPVLHPIERLLTGPIDTLLIVGEEPGQVSMSLVERGVAIAFVHADPAVIEGLAHSAPGIASWCDDPITMQLPRRFHVVWLSNSLLQSVPVEHRRSVVHNAVQHLEPRGFLVTDLCADASPGDLSLEEYDALCADCDLTPIERHQCQQQVSVHTSGLVTSISQRTTRFTIHDLVFEARQRFPRVTAAALYERLSTMTPPLVVDTRTQTDRARFGVIEHSIHVPRTVLEWHLDPANGYRHPSVTSLHQPLVVVCNRGYSSSLAAASLLRLGFTSVADLIGGMHAWIERGLPVVPADHDHLDL